MTYEYVCTACGHGWEAEQPISAAPLKACPSCHAETAKRQVSGGAGFILKGSGWYADLYSSPKPGKDSSAEAKDKDGSKADPKPAANTETKTKTETKKDGGAATASPSTSSSSGDSSSSSTSGSTPTKPANTAQT